MSHPCEEDIAKEEREHYNKLQEIDRLWLRLTTKQHVRIIKNIMRHKHADALLRCIKEELSYGKKT